MSEEKKICPLMSCNYHGAGFITCVREKCMFYNLCKSIEGFAENMKKDSGGEEW